MLVVPPLLPVVVALIADPDNPFGRIASQEEWSRPYAQRRTVSLEVGESESLAGVLERAAEEMELVPPPDWHPPQFSATHNKVAFYRREDEQGFAARHVPRFLLSELTLVDQHGRAIFGVSDLRAVRYTDLLRAAEAGVLVGDPLRPYLIVEAPYGDWVGPDWPTLVDGLKVSWQVLEHVATAGGAIAAIQLLKDEIQKRLRCGEDAVEANAEWAQRRTMPYQFIALLRSRRWRPSELAPLLGCVEPEAEAVLLLLGFSLDETTDEWTYQGDAAAAVMTDLLHEITLAAHRYDEDDAELVRRLVHYFQRSESAPLDRAVEGGHDDAFGTTPGDRIADLGDRVGELVDTALEAVEAGRKTWRSRRR